MRVLGLVVLGLIPGLLLGYAARWRQTRQQIEHIVLTETPPPDRPPVGANPDRFRLPLLPPRRDPE